ncbi:MAG: cytochrome c biogenesis protein CcsA, partial [Methylococcales bacterium]
LSLLAWVIFCAILIGRQRYGWRGRVAVNWILVGFLFLLLSYFGSKFVLELILVRT